MPWGATSYDLLEDAPPETFANLILAVWGLDRLSGIIFPTGISMEGGATNRPAGVLCVCVGGGRDGRLGWDVSKAMFAALLAVCQP